MPRKPNEQPLPSKPSRNKQDMRGQFDDVEISTNEAPKKKVKNKNEHAEYTNRPHPSLEYPPLYWALKACPCLLEAVRPLYHLRWSLAHPLQKRVVLSKLLRKVGVFMTWGELLFLLPFVALLVGGCIYTFISPCTDVSGFFAELALIFAIVTGMRNSLITLVLGMPFERTLWYHKLAGRIALVNGILHAAVAYMKPGYGLESYGSFSLEVLQEFLVGNFFNASGTLLTMYLAGVVLTSLPFVRKNAFEIFYYSHIVLVVLMVIFAFFHAGPLFPIITVLTWGVDIFFRKFVMANCKYSTKGTIKIISDTVIEISFLKKGFDYNPGQHLSIAVPDISLFEWHPFSISTCPRQKHVAIHIRKAGNWTAALYDLARRKRGNEIDILVEGPNGSPEIDFLSDGRHNRYKSFLFIGGGIGITPIQSICNQLVYEHGKGLRDLNRIRLVWTGRDPVLMQSLDIVQNNCPNQVAPLDVEALGTSSGFRRDERGEDDHGISTAGIASTLLSMMPPSRRTDAEIEMDYPNNYFDESSPFDTNDHAFEAAVTDAHASHAVEPAVEESTFHYFDNSSAGMMAQIFDLQVYITSKEAASHDPALTTLPFVHLHRPDIKKIFAEMRDEAIAHGTKDVAVIVCAPARLAHVCKQACVKYSNSKVDFGFHMEYQD